MKLTNIPLPFVILILPFIISCVTRQNVEEQSLNDTASVSNFSKHYGATNIDSCQTDNLTAWSFTLNKDSIYTVTLPKSKTETVSQTYVITPYGMIGIHDSTPLLNFYDWLARKSGNQYEDSINSLILMEVARVSDGALAESIGYCCLKDFKNKLGLIPKIFNDNSKERVSPYIILLLSSLDDMHHSEPENKVLEDIMCNITDEDFRTFVYKTFYTIRNESF